jgi:hypothetical protein
MVIKSIGKKKRKSLKTTKRKLKQKMKQKFKMQQKGGEGEDDRDGGKVEEETEQLCSFCGRNRTTTKFTRKVEGILKEYYKCDVCDSVQKNKKSYWNIDLKHYTECDDVKGELKF